jgi:hypothetical protein
MTPARREYDVLHPTGWAQWAGGRYNGTNLTGSRGSGKSTFAADIGFYDFLHDGGIGQILLDPIGVGLIDTFLWRLWGFLKGVPRSHLDRFLRRVKYINVAATDSICAWPLLYKTGKERSLLDVAERYLQTILLTSPWLMHAQVQGWPPLHYIGAQTAVILAALDEPLTIAFDLLRNPEQWRSAGRFAEAVKRYPAEAGPAAAFFLDEYIPAGQANRRRLLNPYFDRLFLFQLDPQLRAMFGASTPGIDWEEVEREKQTVLIDFRDEMNQELKRFKLLWILSVIFGYIKLRGRRNYPLGLICDEFSSICSHMPGGSTPLGDLMSELITIYQRNHHVYFTCSYQSVATIPESLRYVLLRLGNLVVGKPPTMTEARLMADLIFARDPYRVQHYKNTWGSDYSRSTGRTGHYVIDQEPVYLPLESQLELNALRLYHQRLFEFMLRPAVGEGDVAAEAFPINIAHLARDRKTGEFSFPDQAIVPAFRTLLAAQSGVPMQTLLAEQDALLQPAPPAQGNGRQPPLRDQEKTPAPLRNPGPAEPTPTEAGHPRRHRVRLS